MYLEVLEVQSTEWYTPWISTTIHYLSSMNACADHLTLMAAVMVWITQLHSQLIICNPAILYPSGSYPGGPNISKALMLLLAQIRESLLNCAGYTV